MLVLTRKLMEKVYIGDKICVTVVRLEGGQVRLGIEAPREISVIRAELLDDRERPVKAPVLATREPEPSESSGNQLGLRTPRVAAPGNGIRRRGPSR